MGSYEVVTVWPVFWVAVVVPVLGVYVAWRLGLGRYLPGLALMVAGVAVLIWGTGLVNHGQPWPGAAVALGALAATGWGSMLLMHARRRPGAGRHATVELEDE